LKPCRCQYKFSQDSFDIEHIAPQAKGCPTTLELFFLGSLRVCVENINRTFLVYLWLCVLKELFVLEFCHGNYAEFAG
jgi:hypothetical protein